MPCRIVLNQPRRPPRLLMAGALVLGLILGPPPASAQSCNPTLAAVDSAAAEAAAEDEARLYEAMEAEIARDRAAGLYAVRYAHHSLALDSEIRIHAKAEQDDLARDVYRVLLRLDLPLSLAGVADYPGRDRRPVDLHLLDTSVDTGALGDSFCPDGRCEVNLYPGLWRDMSREALEFTLAHEMFHVVQDKVHPSINQCESSWWVEGTAEWFANLAVPGQDDSRLFLSRWDDAVKGLRLIDIDYPAVAFWFWAAELNGPTYPLHLARLGEAALAEPGAIAAQMSAEAWSNLMFVHLTDALAFPDGRSARIAPDPGRPLLEEDGLVVLGGPPLSLQRGQVVLGPGLWTLTLEGASPGTVALLARESGGGYDALRPGEAVQRFFGCGEGGTLLFAAGFGSAERTEARLRIAEAEGGAACGDCLHGTWEMTTPRDPTDDGFAARMQAMVAAHEGMTIESLYDHPGPRLTLRPDGRYRWEDPKTGRAFAAGEDGTVEILTRLATNEETGRFQETEGLLLFRKDAALSAGTVTISAGPLSGHEAFEDPRAHVPLLPQPYRLAACSGTEMVWERAVEPDMQTTRVFRRIN